MNTDYLKQVMDTVKSRFVLAENSEITLELNPGDVNHDNMAIWTDTGFNRFSLGVQSLDNDALNLLGRRHNADEAVRAIDIIRQWTTMKNRTDVGKRLRFNIDLIMGIPGQSEVSWLETLIQALNCRPDHISCYQLTVEQDTSLSEIIDSGIIQPVSESMDTKLFELTHQTLTTNGYIHYEISNYAYGYDNCSKHNLKYWFHIPYLGIGSSAHSYDGTTRWWNTSDMDTYCDNIKTGLPVIDGFETVDNRKKRNEAIFLQLRTQWGLDRNLFGKVPELMEKLVQGEFIVMTGSRFRPELSGMAIADHLAELLLEI